MYRCPATADQKQTLDYPFINEPEFEASDKTKIRRKEASMRLGYVVPTQL